MCCCPGPCHLKNGAPELIAQLTPARIYEIVAAMPDPRLQYQAYPDANATLARHADLLTGRLAEPQALV